MHDNTLDKQFKEKPRVTPYDTGKIKIGVYYKPPRQRQSDEDLMLQSLLLGDKTNFMPQFHFDIKYLMYFVMGFVGYLVIMALVR